MMAAGPRNFPNNLLTRIHGAFSTSVTPPRLEINRKTIEKTWKLMDKVVMISDVARAFFEAPDKYMYA